MSTIKIIRGSTYRDTVRWSSSECVFVAAQVQPGAPLRLMAQAHGFPDGFTATIEGHRQIAPTQAYPLRVVDPDVLEVPCLNGVAFAPGPVQIRYYRPVAMLGYAARMRIRDKPGGVVLHEMSSAAGDIVIDAGTMKIVREIPADVTAGFAWRRGVFDLEMVQGDYVIKIDAGAVEVSGEVTA